MLDIKLIYLTVLSIISREKALAKISGLLAGMKADKELIEISLRKSPLTPAPPPGTDKIVTSRDGKVDY